VAGRCVRIDARARARGMEQGFTLKQPRRVSMLSRSLSLSLSLFPGESEQLGAEQGV